MNNISATTTLPEKRLSPLPIRHVPAEEWSSNYDRSDDLLLYGHCAEWCNVLEDPTRSGVSVAEHGSWCQAGRGGVDGWDFQARRASVYPALVRRYTHGAYAPRYWGDGPAPYDTMVQLGILAEGVEADDPKDGECKPLFLSTGEARNLAALLVWLADEAENMHEPFRAREERRRA